MAFTDCFDETQKMEEEEEFMQAKWTVKTLLSGSWRWASLDMDSMVIECQDREYVVSKYVNLLMKVFVFLMCAM